MSNEPRQTDRSPIFEDVEEITSFAQDYFSTDFPNPSGIKCPTADEIEKLIGARRIPPDHLLKHLFECSNCFQLYREMLAARENNVVPLTTIWGSLFAFGRQPLVAAAALVFVLLIFSGIAILYFRNQTRRVAVSNGNTQSGITPSTETPVEQSPGASTSVHIDFDGYGFQRGDENGEKASAKVSPTRVRFFITLPQSSPVGEYAVFVDDAYGHTVRKIMAQSSDGKTLAAEIDLSKLPQRRYRLCISRAAESPSCYPITLQ